MRTQQHPRNSLPIIPACHKDDILLAAFVEGCITSPAAISYSSWRSLRFKKWYLLPGWKNYYFFEIVTYRKALPFVSAIWLNGWTASI